MTRPSSRERRHLAVESLAEPVAHAALGMLERADARIAELENIIRGTQTMPTCSTCRHVHADQGTLTCRRYPPAVVLDPLKPNESSFNFGGSKTRSVWPRVEPTESCGEHAERTSNG